MRIYVKYFVLNFLFVCCPRAVRPLHDTLAMDDALAIAVSALHAKDPPRHPIPTKCNRRSMTLVTHHAAIVWRSTHRHMFGRVAASWAHDTEGVLFKCSTCHGTYACEVPRPSQSWDDKVRKKFGGRHSSRCGEALRRRAAAAQRRADRAAQLDQASIADGMRDAHPATERPRRSGYALVPHCGALAGDSSCHASAE